MLHELWYNNVRVIDDYIITFAGETLYNGKGGVLL